MVDSERIFVSDDNTTRTHRRTAAVAMLLSG